LDGLFRQVEVSDRADEAGERPSLLLPEQALDDLTDVRS
jgi:hypothetical protein